MCYKRKQFVHSRRLVVHQREERARGFPQRLEADVPRQRRGVPGVQDRNHLTFNPFILLIFKI